MDKQPILAFVLLIGVILALAFPGFYGHHSSNVTATPIDTSIPTIYPTPVSSPTPTPIPVVKTLEWSGYSWIVDDYRGGVFTTNNVWVDSEGRLHMKLIYKDGKWNEFNVILKDPIGYGTYSWTVDTDLEDIQDVQDGGNPNFIFSGFSYDDSLPDYNYGEIDIEHCKWGNPDLDSNTDWTIHPANHLVQYKHITGANNTDTIEWMPDHIKFSVQGPSQPYMEYVFNDHSQIPPASGYMQWLFYVGEVKSHPPPNNIGYYEAEVVIRNFKIVPYTA
ncbi:MAG TPA: hypothetical protein VMC84_06865 [Methanocella sp.]|uniref:hypothetical protein n=1 Tax=Methanocella sp. TaxID=2052833 RepID=UPI002B5409EF|nr:hypothetical protein [Methanocella sp.]HTY90883.1 hypothetical protein [Methanocella sp.]